MQTTTEIVQNINSLPLLQRISIIENLLASVKEDTFKQIENNPLNDVRVVYQLFLLNNETITLHSFINQITENQIPITKGDKQLNPKELFGIWEEKPRNLNDIREHDWKRDWDI